MPILPRVASLWRNAFQRADRERELEGELRSYVDLLTDEKIRQGMTPEEGRRAALLEVGGVEQVKEEVRNAWVGAWAHLLSRDLRHGLRLMARSPGFTFVAVISLALGVGGTAAAFGVVDA